MNHFSQTCTQWPSAEKGKKKKGIILIYAHVSRKCKAQTWQSPTADFTQILLSRCAESCTFPVNCKLMLSANAFWTVSCTVNSQDETAICLSNVKIKRKVSRSGFHTGIGAFTRNDASCHSVLFSNFSAAGPGQWYEILNIKESLCLTLQPKGDKSAKQAQCRK